MEPQSNILVFETPEQLALAAAERFVEYSNELGDSAERFSVALAGRNTPRQAYELLATARWKRSRCGLGQPGNNSGARSSLRLQCQSSIMRDELFFWLQEKKRRNASKKCYALNPDQSSCRFRRLRQSKECLNGWWMLTQH